MIKRIIYLLWFQFVYSVLVSLYSIYQTHHIYSFFVGLLPLVLTYSIIKNISKGNNIRTFYSFLVGFSTLYYIFIYSQYQSKHLSFNTIKEISITVFFLLINIYVLIQITSKPIIQWGEFKKIDGATNKNKTLFLILFVIGVLMLIFIKLSNEEILSDFKSLKSNNELQNLIEKKLPMTDSVTSIIKSLPEMAFQVKKKAHIS